MKKFEKPEIEVVKVVNEAIAMHLGNGSVWTGVPE